MIEYHKFQVHPDRERLIEPEKPEEKAPESRPIEVDEKEDNLSSQNRPNAPILPNVPPPMLMPPGSSGMFPPPGLNPPGFPPPVGRFGLIYLFNDWSTYF